MGHTLSKYIKKWLSKWLLIPLIKAFYLSKQTHLQIKGIALKIPVGVFHPSLYFSTQFLGEWLENQSIRGLKVLELGAGAGYLSIKAAQMGAIVTASDVSTLACETVRFNAAQNKIELTVLASDLFDNFNQTTFDLILINPPYYPKSPKNEADFAWFCGENFEYFQRLFSTMKPFLAQNGKAIMVLSEDCNIDKISHLAQENGFLWQKIKEEKNRIEMNFLFEILDK